jgi:hypothetical protein
VLDQLATILEEEVWLAKQKSPRTRCAYKVDVQHFMATLATTALPKFGGEDGNELRFPFPYRLVAEDDPALEEHFAEVLEREPVAQAPKHHECDDVTRILGPVQ